MLSKFLAEGAKALVGREFYYLTGELKQIKAKVLHVIRYKGGMLYLAVEPTCTKLLHIEDCHEIKNTSGEMG